MKAAAWVSGHWLHIFGGLWEGASRETTLDDAWRIDLRSRARWELLLPARAHEWRIDWVGHTPGAATVRGEPWPGDGRALAYRPWE